VQARPSHQTPGHARVLACLLGAAALFLVLSPRVIRRRPSFAPVVILLLLGALATVGLTSSTASTTAEGPYAFSKYGWTGTINYKYEQHWRSKEVDRDTVITVALAVREDGDADYVGGWLQAETTRDLSSQQCTKTTWTGAITETRQASVGVYHPGAPLSSIGYVVPQFTLERIQKFYKETSCSTLVREETATRTEFVPGPPSDVLIRPEAPDVPKLVGVDVQKPFLNDGGYFDLGDVTFTTKVNLIGCGEESGGQWVKRFAPDNRLSALNDSFETNVRAFIAALRAAGATVKITQVYRPQPRAYLMHYSWRIAYGRGTGKYSKVEPDKVPPYNEGPEKVPICWMFRDDTRNAGSYLKNVSIQLAENMAGRYGYRIVVGHGAAYPTNHEKRTAIDMNIQWEGFLRIKPGKKAPFREDDSLVEIVGEPRTGMHPRLWRVGRSYGVIKYVNAETPDPPHWSANGS
jgi:hypothetical protein